MNKTLLAAALVAASGLAGASLASANPELTISLQNGNGPLPLVTETTSNNGTASFSGSLGSFTTINVYAAGSPTVSLPSLLDTNSFQVSSSSGGTLMVVITESDLTTPLGAYPIASGFTLNGVNLATTGSREATYLTTDDGASSIDGAPLDSTSILLDSESFTSAGGSITDVANMPNLTGPYALTAIYTIVLGDDGNANGTIDLSSVPEPGSLALFGAAFLGLGLSGRARRRAFGAGQSARARQPGQPACLGK